MEHLDVMEKRRLNGFGRKSMTQDEFIEKAQKVHGYKYDYSKTVYKPAIVIEGKQKRNKVCIICLEHGEFFQYPQSHLFGKGCISCSGIKRSTTQEFIVKAEKVHGKNHYDYSEVKYANAVTKVKIKCLIHGIFLQSPQSHLDGCGCKSCAFDKQKLNNNSFIERARAVHGPDKFSYENMNYRNAKNKVIITCKIHGDFYQKPYVHLGGNGCRECNAERHRIPLKDIILRARNRHGWKYDYSKARPLNNIHEKMTIICPKHGDFQQAAAYHSSGQGCPFCSRSLGEEAIAKWLIDRGIKFNSQHTFPELVGNGKKFKRVLPVDFFLKDRNIVIEFDGLQHFEPVCFNGISKEIALDNFENTKRVDSLKTAYCRQHGIFLLRVPYKKIKKIPEILADALSGVATNV